MSRNLGPYIGDFNSTLVHHEPRRGVNSQAHRDMEAFRNVLPLPSFICCYGVVFQHDTMTQVIPI